MNPGKVGKLTKYSKNHNNRLSENLVICATQFSCYSEASSDTVFQESYISLV
jgi:hypothetical protein